MSENQNYVPTPERSGNNSPVGMGDWMLTIFLLGIPVVNLILLFIWGFGDQTPVSKKNFARASLIWMGIGIVLSVLFGGPILAMIAALSTSYM